MVQAVAPAAGSGLPCNRVIDWRPDSVKINIWSPDLDDLLILMENKRERNDAEGVKFNARRYVKMAGLLADEALHNLAQSEINKHTHLISACYLLGIVALICAPLSAMGVIVPIGITLIAVECLNLRMQRRVADIESFCVSKDQDLQIQLNFPDQSAEPVVKIPAQKGGRDD